VYVVMAFLPSNNRTVEWMLWNALNQLISEMFSSSFVDKFLFWGVLFSYFFIFNLSHNRIRLKAIWNIIAELNIMTLK